MLNENDVVTAVCGHLKNQGYTNIKFRKTTERGVDIIAEHSSRPERLLIEAKGGTSARPGSSRYGRDYDPNQVFDRVAKGFYTAATLHCAHCENGDKIGLAFPDSPLFRKYLDPIMPALNRLGIQVFMVCQDGRVISVATKAVN